MKSTSVKAYKIQDLAKTYRQGTELNLLSLRSDFAPTRKTLGTNSLGVHSLRYNDK